MINYIDNATILFNSLMFQINLINRYFYYFYNNFFIENGFSFALW